MSTYRTYRFRLQRLACWLLLFLGVVGCNTDKLVEVAPPTTGVDPATFQTPKGAQRLYNNAISLFYGKFMDVSSTAQVFFTSMFSDELSAGFNISTNLRREPEDLSGQYYQQLHATRVAIELAIGPMQQYAPPSSKALVGQLYAFGGYVVTWFAEQFCSGIPLSTVVYEGDIVYGGPLTTEQLHLNALARFDAALEHAADSARILNLARVGKGRVLLHLGRFADAAAAVKDVPTSFQYLVQRPENVFARMQGYTVGDREGTNGLNYVSANDPRVRTEVGGQSVIVQRPVMTLATPLVLADGIEARLIEAEAALQANDIAGWAAKLNALRATCAASNPACPAAIAPLTADSTTTANATLRVDVMFRERAFWTFLTGHRAGDLRRLVRQYKRPQQSVYPVGDLFYGGDFIGQYGNIVNSVVHGKEIEHNPNYHGCLNREA